MRQARVAHQLRLEYIRRQHFITRLRLSNAMKVVVLSTLVLFSLALSGSAQATAGSGDESVTITSVIGDLSAVEAANNQLKLKTTAGEFTIVLTDKSRYMQLAPGETSLAKSERIDLAKVNVGDLVMARGRVTIEQLTVHATHVIVMKKEDIARKRERAGEEWRRGIVGRVTATNQLTKEVTLGVRSLGINGGIAAVGGGSVSVANCRIEAQIRFSF
jgi:hypothetical protein